MWQSHLSQQAAGVCSRSKVAGVLLLPGGGGWRGAEARPPRSSGALGIPSSEFIYFFISQNEDKFPVLERIEWQIPYSDIFGNHPGGFVV